MVINVIDSDSVANIGIYIEFYKTVDDIAAHTHNDDSNDG